MIVKYFIILSMLLQAFTAWAAGTYGTLTKANVTSAQARAFQQAWSSIDTKGIMGSSFDYDPVTETFKCHIKIDSEELPNGVTLATLRTRIQGLATTHLGAPFDSYNAKQPGEIGRTGRDRTRQFIACWDSNCDPQTIGIHGRDFADRRKRLQKTMTASRRAWGL